MKKDLMDRRMFARGLALTPFGLAAASNVLGQTTAPAAAIPVAAPAVVPPNRKTDAANNGHPRVQEKGPFARPLVFRRNE